MNTIVQRLGTFLTGDSGWNFTFFLDADMFKDRLDFLVEMLALSDQDMTEIETALDEENKLIAEYSAQAPPS